MTQQMSGCDLRRGFLVDQSAIRVSFDDILVCKLWKNLCDWFVKTNKFIVDTLKEGDARN